MGGSGIKEVLCEVYAENSVQYILSGKSVSRAVRAHSLIDGVLNALINSTAFGFELMEKEGDEQLKEAPACTETAPSPLPSSRLPTTETEGPLPNEAPTCTETAPTPLPSSRLPTTATTETENPWPNEAPTCTEKAPAPLRSPRLPTTEKEDPWPNESPACTETAPTPLPFHQPTTETEDPWPKESPACTEIAPTPIPPSQPSSGVTENKSGSNLILNALLEAYDKVVTGELPTKELNTRNSSDFQIAEELLLQTKKKLAEHRTAKLWLQYMDMVDILRLFLRAERTGDWEMHLHSLQRMLPYLAAGGHHLYTKSLYIYLMKMQDLNNTNPDLYTAFMEGQHVLRRSDRFWAGISSDLAIEQLLMRSVKSAGGLTRGRGMEESQRTQWLLSMPACAKMNDAMHELTGLNGAVTSSAQHYETTAKRQAKDNEDMKSILEFRLKHNPFEHSEQLRNISNGVTADARVNVDNAEAVGINIINSMKTEKVKDYRFVKASQVVTFDVKSSAKVGDETIKYEPQLLFQRIVTAAFERPEQFDLPSVF